MQITLAKLAEKLNGTLIGNGEVTITKPAKLQETTSDSITFVADTKYEPFISTTDAAGYLIGKEIDYSAYPEKSFIQVDDVYSSLAILLNLFDNENRIPAISDLASISDECHIGAHVNIGAFSSINTKASIGDNTWISSSVYIGENVQIGKDVVIHSGVRIYKSCSIGDNTIIHANTVIGSDGFGFAPQSDGSYAKIPQIGIVRIGNNVEIGASCTIDRASIGETVIDDGAKLDNLIHIAHNVTIGKHTVIAAQVGIAGSTKIGSFCMIGGQAGIVGHLDIADKTIFQAKTGMTKSVKKPGTKWYGYPAIEYNNYLKSYAHFKNLDRLSDKVKSLEEEIKKLKSGEGTDNN